MHLADLKPSIPGDNDSRNEADSGNHYLPEWAPFAPYHQKKRPTQKDEAFSQGQGLLKVSVELPEA